MLNYCICFGRPSRPSSGVHKPVVSASVTDHTSWGARFLKRDVVTFEESVPEAATTGLYTPSDGRDGRPKDVK